MDVNQILEELRGKPLTFEVAKWAYQQFNKQNDIIGSLIDSNLGMTGSLALARATLITYNQRMNLLENIVGSMIGSPI